MTGRTLTCTTASGGNDLPTLTLDGRMTTRARAKAVTLLRPCACTAEPEAKPETGGTTVSRASSSASSGVMPARRRIIRASRCGSALVSQLRALPDGRAASGVLLLRCPDVELFFDTMSSTVARR